MPQAWRHPKLRKIMSHLLLQMTYSIMPDKNIHMRIAGMAVFERNLTTLLLRAWQPGVVPSRSDHCSNRRKRFVWWYPNAGSFQRNHLVDPVFTERPASYNYLYHIVFPFRNKRRCYTPGLHWQQRAFFVDLSHLALSDEQNYAKMRRISRRQRQVESGWNRCSSRWFRHEKYCREIFTVINAIHR